MAEKVIGKLIFAVILSFIVYAVRVLSNYSTLCFLKVFTTSLKMWKPGSSFLKSAMSYGERSNPASLTFAVLTGGGSW